MPRRHRSKLFAPIAMGLVLFGLAAACLMGAAALEQPSLGVRQLVVHDDVILMSCDPSLAASPPAPDHEPLWCANPDSPHCLPGHQLPSHHESSVGPVAAFAAPLASPTAFLWNEAFRWPAVRSVPRYAYVSGQRLERPPRHS